MLTEHSANSLKIIGPNVFKTIEYDSISEFFSIQWLSKCGPRATNDIIWNLSELQTPESCPRTINSETIEVGLAICVLTSPPEDSGVGSCLRAIALQAQIRVRFLVDTKIIIHSECL